MAADMVERPSREPVIHDPAMVREVLTYLECGPGKTFVDATVGAGGHAAAILAATSPDGFLVGIDRDREVLEMARRRLHTFRGRFVVAHGNFSALTEILAGLGIDKVDGLLLDLGVSSWQLDRPERGFSFRTAAPLDMRMDPGEGRTAADLIRECSEEELAGIIREFGEERRGRMIARAILREVSGSRMPTTVRLAEIVAASVGGRPRGRRFVHPATRTFQALRIAVNGELNSLGEVLRQVPDVLAPGGRCCCLSYHSLEDRMVKNAFRDMAGRGTQRRTPVLEVLTKKPLRPGQDEVLRNPRSRAARLRAARRKEGG